MSHLDQFPADFIQVPRFQFPISDGSEEICALSVLPSERLVIATALPERPLTHCLPEVFAFSSVQHGLVGIYGTPVCIYHTPPMFRLVVTESFGSSLISTLRLLFSVPGAELTPAHLRQLVGMLPAIRKVMAEGQGGGE